MSQTFPSTDFIVQGKQKWDDSNSNEKIINAVPYERLRGISTIELCSEMKRDDFLLTSNHVHPNVFRESLERHHCLLRLAVVDP